MSISNWHFNRDKQYLKFGPRCRAEDVCVSFKLSSSAFAPANEVGPSYNSSHLNDEIQSESADDVSVSPTTDDSQFNFDKNGVIIPYSAFVSLMDDPNFLLYLEKIKAKYEETEGSLERIFKLINGIENGDDDNDDNNVDEEDSEEEEEIEDPLASPKKRKKPIKKIASKKEKKKKSSVIVDDDDDDDEQPADMTLRSFTPMPAVGLTEIEAETAADYFSSGAGEHQFDPSHLVVVPLASGGKKPPTGKRGANNSKK
jgi:hypothetical protein